MLKRSKTIHSSLPLLILVSPNLLRREKVLQHQLLFPKMGVKLGWLTKLLFLIVATEVQVVNPQAENPAVYNF
jgi:hypothetical protein